MGTCMLFPCRDVQCAVGVDTMSCVQTVCVDAGRYVGPVVERDVQPPDTTEMERKLDADQHLCV